MPIKLEVRQLESTQSVRATVQGRIDAVVDQETLERQRQSLLLGLCLIYDAARDKGNVIPRIRFASDKQLLLDEFWKYGI